MTFLKPGSMSTNDVLNWKFIDTMHVLSALFSDNLKEYLDFLITTTQFYNPADQIYQGCS